MMFEIWVTSTSTIKIAAIWDIFSQAQTEFRIIPHSMNCANPNQPINSTLECAKNRFTGLRWIPSTPPGLIISIENGLEVTDTQCHSVCCVVLWDPRDDRYICGKSDLIPLDRKYYEQAVAESSSSSLGLTVTVGQMINREFPDISAENWSAHPRFGGYDRKDQIKQALQRALDQLK